MNKWTNIGINIFRGAITPLLNFIVLIVGIRIYGKESWGTVINIIIWVSLLVFVLNWGNKDYLVRKYSREPSRLYNAFYSSLFSRSLLLPLCVLFAIFFPFPIALYSIFLVLLMHCYASLDSLVVFQQRFKAQLIAEVIGFAVIIVGIYTMASFELLQFLQWYGLSTLVKLAYLFFALGLWKVKPTASISLREFGFSLPFFALGLSGMVNSKIDLYLVNSFLSSGKISDYQVLTSAFLMLQSLSVFMTAPLSKGIYRSGTQTVEKLGILFKKLAIPFALAGSACIWLILEKGIQLGLEMHLYVLAFLASLPAFFYVIPILKMYRSQLEKKVLLSNIGAAALNAVGSLILLPRLGISGVLISVCISQWVYLILIKKYENNPS